MKLFFSALFSFMIVQLFAQSAPQKMSYQAVARNSSGVTLNNQNIRVKAEIVDADLTTVLYAETHSTTTNQFGLFTLQIGTGSILSGTFFSINWGVGDKYIRTSADLTGGTNYQLLGTSQLLTVPYAFYAEKTKLIAGNGISITNGNTIAATGTGSQWKRHSFGIYNDTSHIGIGTIPQQFTAFTIRPVRVNNAGNGILHLKSPDTWHSAIGIFNGTGVNEKQFSYILAGPSNSNAANGTFGLFNHQSYTWTYNTDGGTNNFFAIGSNSVNARIPKSRLHVFAGDINIDQIGSGIIMKSPNGNCWRVTIDDSGNLVRTAITCP